MSSEAAEPSPMTNEQLLIIVVPLVLTQITQIVVLVFGFSTSNKRFDDVNGRFNDVNRRFDDINRDINRRFDEVLRRLESIEKKLDGHNERIVRLEERASPISRA